MGTNYYLVDKSVCPTCGSRKERRHIGKSSVGWCFALRIYPEEGIETLDDWKKLLAKHNGMNVENGCGDYVSRQTMLDVITDRGWFQEKPIHDPEKLRENYTCAGPNGLLRSLVDGTRCVGHGEGTWDYFLEDFS